MFGSLKDVPARYDGFEAEAAFEGEYVSTTMFGDELNRVGFDQLGFKTKSTLLIYSDGIIFTRNGAKDLWIPAKKLAVITTGRGMIGKVVERDGLIVIGWTLDGHRVQTGFRTRYADQKKIALEKLREISPDAVDSPEKWVLEETAHHEYTDNSPTKCPLIANGIPRISCTQCSTYNGHKQGNRPPRKGK